MSPPRARRPHGQIRQSQVIRTFGPGALLELPSRSVIVGGLEMWMPDQPHQMGEIHEPRLVANVEEKLGKTGLRLFAPPLDDDDPGAPPNGITAFQFPEWFVTQDVDEGSTGGARSRHLVHRRALDNRGRYVDDDRKARPVVPVRFVRACRRGHIGDIDWDVFAHGRRSQCRPGSLRMDERGTSGDLSEISVRCVACGENQPMLLAASRKGGLLGRCDGRQPWLGPQSREACQESNRLLVRTATHAYFAQTVSVISLPEAENAVAQAVEQVWQHYLEYVETAEDLLEQTKVQYQVGVVSKVRVTEAEDLGAQAPANRRQPPT